MVKDIYKQLSTASVKELKEVRIFCDQIILSHNYKGLNAGQREVLYYFKQGLLKKDVADKCCVEVYTIDKRLLQMYKKFNVHSIYQLILM